MSVPGPVLVIGYGNRLRSDDGVGPAVAERLAADSRLAAADVRCGHQLTPELALDASRASLLVLVDAAAEEPPGAVSVRGVVPVADPGTAWTHHLDPPGLLGLARELYGAAPPAFVVSVGTASLAVGESLSPPVAAAVDDVVDRVVALVAAHEAGAG